MRLIDADLLEPDADYDDGEFWAVSMTQIHKASTIEPEPQWILCSKRLPENSCQCIVTAKVKHVDNYPDYEVDTADFSDGIFTTANSWWGVESIIAWMPIPEPWEGEQP